MSEVRIRIRRKEEELIPGACVYAFDEPAPKLPIDYATITYEGRAYTPWNTSSSNRAELTAGKSIRAKATITNETVDGRSVNTLFLAGYIVETEIAVLAKSGYLELAEGESHDFSVDFYMPDKNVDIVLVSVHFIEWGKQCPIAMSAPIYVAPEVHAEACQLALLEDQRLEDYYEVGSGVTIELASAAYNCGDARGGLYTSLYIDGTRVASEQKILDNLPITAVQENYVASRKGYTMPGEGKRVEVRRVGGHGGYTEGEWSNVPDYDKTTTLVAIKQEGAWGTIYLPETSPKASTNQIIGTEVNVKLAIKNTSTTTGRLKGVVSGIPDTESYSYEQILKAEEVAVMPTTLTFPMPEREVRIKYQVYSEGVDGLRMEPDETQIYVLTPITGVPEEVIITGIWRDEEGTWNVGVDLVLEEPYASTIAELSGYYKYYYKINVRSPDGTHEIYARTPKDESKFHLTTTEPEMDGRAEVNWNPPTGSELKVELWRTNIDTGIEEGKPVFTTTAAIPTGGFRVSVSDAFFNSPYIWWWDGEQTVHCYECILGHVPGILLRVPVPNILVPPIEKVVKQGEVAEFTSADGLKEGKIYAFGISFFHAVDQAINGLIYKSYGSVQEVHLVPVPGVGDSICPLLGVDPKSYECTLELAEFADPIYVANTLRKIVDHKDIAGNTAEPDTIDYIFLPIALLSGVVPAGTLGKKLAGPILKNVKGLSVVDTWIKRNWIRIQAAVIRSDDFSGDVALDRISEAAKAVEGSDNQKALLEEGGRILDDLIGDSKLTYKEVVKKEKLFTDEIGKKLDDVGSKTPANEVVEKSGVKGAADYIPKLGKIDFDSMAGFKEAARRGGALDDVIESLGRLQKELTEAGRMPIKRKALYVRIFQWSKEHRIATGAIVGIAFCLWWWGMDNLQFIIALLRRTKLLDDVWGDQWDDYVREMTTLYYKIKDDPCDKYYQENYIHLLERLRNLIEGIKPIPTGKIARTIYLLNVLYGRDIGDPNERVIEDTKLLYETQRHWYYELTMGCSSPLVPEWVKDEYEEFKFEYTVKVQKVMDGDTFSMSSSDPDWPFDEVESIRVLGADTPDPVKDSYGNILGYEVRRKPLPEKEKPEDLATPVTKEEFKAATIFTTDVIDHQLVTIRIDPLNIRDKHGRLLASVKVDNEQLLGDLGQALLREGHAMVFFYTPNAIMDAETRESYIAAETTARDAKLGVWSGEGEALPTGKIRCESTPEGAYIYIDDETAPQEVTNHTLDDITVGNHEVEFKGITYKRIECKDCACGYPVTVEEGKTPLVKCDLTAICEILQPKWIDKDGTTWRRYPTIWLDDGTTRSSIGSPDEGEYPFKITFGKEYTGLGQYAIIENGYGLLTRDCDLGDWRIELELKDHKTLSSEFSFTPGIYKRLAPVLEEGLGVGGPIPEEQEPEPEEGIGHLTINRPINVNTGTEVSGSIKVHIDGVYINRYAGYSTTKDIKCCAGCYCNADKKVGDCSLGTHTLTLTKTDYLEWSDTITLEEGVTTEVTAEMVPADGSVTGAVGGVDAKSIYIGTPSEYSATVVNTGNKMACYRMKFNFTGIDPGVADNYYEYPLRFEDEPDDGWSIYIGPNEEVTATVWINIPEDAMPPGEEYARYSVGLELQVAEAL